MAGGPKPVWRRTTNNKGKMNEATKGTDLNGREPLAAGGKENGKKWGLT